MKKIVMIALSILLSAIFVVLVALFVRNYIIPLLNIGSSQISAHETFLIASQSPDGEFNLEAYRTEPGATVDFSIRVYVIEDNKKRLIYDAYHEYEAEIVWINHSTVSINKKELDLSQKETYDWRMQ